MLQADIRLGKRWVVRELERERDRNERPRVLLTLEILLHLRGWLLFITQINLPNTSVFVWWPQQ